MSDKIKQFQEETCNKICKFLCEKVDIESIEDYNRLQFDLGYSLLEVLSKHENKKVAEAKRAYLTTHQPFWNWWRADYAQHDHYFLVQTQNFKLTNLENYREQDLDESQKWLVYQFSKHLHISNVKAPDFFKLFTYNT